MLMASSGCKDTGRLGFIAQREFVDKPRQTDLRLMWGIGCWGPRFTAHLADFVARHEGDRESVPSDVFNVA